MEVSAPLLGSGEKRRSNLRIVRSVRLAGVVECHAPGDRGRAPLFQSLETERDKTRAPLGEPIDHCAVYYCTAKGLAQADPYFDATRALRFSAISFSSTFC